jgi:sulfotransferase
LSQLDVDFDRTYAHLKSATRGFVRGWYHDCTKPLVVDKNRGWLRNFEYLLAVEPDAKLLVCVRELGQVYGSIEAQHQRTILIDFPDHTANHDRYNRADVLFAKDGVIGNPLRALEAVQDLPVAIQQRVHLVIFERLVRDPLAAMTDVYKFLDIDPAQFDPKSYACVRIESDSHYRHKYPHRQYASIEALVQHAILTSSRPRSRRPTPGTRQLLSALEEDCMPPAPNAPENAVCSDAFDLSWQCLIAPNNRANYFALGETLRAFTTLMLSGGNVLSVRTSQPPVFRHGINCIGSDSHKSRLTRPRLRCATPSTLQLQSTRSASTARR